MLSILLVLVHLQIFMTPFFLPYSTRFNCNKGTYLELLRLVFFCCLSVATMMWKSATVLLLMSTIQIGTSQYWLPFPEGCSDQCQHYFNVCAEDCISKKNCPPEFPPFLHTCSLDCQWILEQCKEDCLDDGGEGCEEPCLSPCPDVTSDNAEKCADYPQVTITNPGCCLQKKDGCKVFGCDGGYWKCLEDC